MNNQPRKTLSTQQNLVFTKKAVALNPVQQPCKTCDRYQNGWCSVGGDVLPHWTGCIVWQLKNHLNLD